VNRRRGQSPLDIKKPREIFNHGRVAGKFDCGPLKAAKKSQPVLGHLNEQTTGPTELADSTTSPLTTGPMLGGGFDRVVVDRCRPQVHLANNHIQLARDSLQRGKGRTISRPMDQVTFALACQRSFVVAGYDGRILEQRLEHGQASYRKGKT
jgi:hypothetical protein